MRLLIVFFCVGLAATVVYAAPAKDDNEASDENISVEVNSDCCDWRKQCTCCHKRDGDDSDGGGEVSDGDDGKKKNCNCEKYRKCCLKWDPRRRCCRKWNKKCCCKVDKDTQISVHVKCCDRKKCHRKSKKHWPWPWTKDGSDGNDDNEGDGDDGGDDGDDDNDDDGDDGKGVDGKHKKKCCHHHKKKCCEDQNITIKLKVDDCCCKRKHKKKCHKKCHKKHPHKDDGPTPDSGEQPVIITGILTPSSDSVELIEIDDNGVIKELGHTKHISPVDASAAPAV